MLTPALWDVDDEPRLNAGRSRHAACRSPHAIRMPIGGLQSRGDGNPPIDEGPAEAGCWRVATVTLRPARIPRPKGVKCAIRRRRGGLPA